MALSNGTAIAPEGYTSTPISVVLGNGEMSKTVTIPIGNDTLIESAETINLMLTTPTGGATIGTQNTAMLTIVDEDVQLAFSAPSFSVNENGTPIAAIVVTRTGRSSSAVGATLTLSNGTAIAPGDYNNTPITVLFASGETSKTVTIPIVDDTAIEVNETIGLVLSNPTGGATIGTQSTTTLTIVNDDFAQLAFSTPDFSVLENGTALVTVTRSGQGTGAAGATIALSNGTAIAPGDYSNSTPLTVTFAAGETGSKTIGVPIINDTLIENNETIGLG